MWTTVCDCYEKTYTCNQDCLEKELRKEDKYYQAVLELYRNVTDIYPPELTDIWVTGHSLGGALASYWAEHSGCQQWHLKHQEKC